jgi:hypothetical protein
MRGRGPHGIEKNFVGDARQERGKFRSFLLTTLKAYLANEWDRQHAQKRGGFQTRRKEIRNDAPLMVVPYA